MRNRLSVDQLEKRAIELFQQGKWQEAIQVNLRILDVMSNDVHAYNRLGNAYQTSGDRAKAIEAYTKALEVDPRNPIAQRSLSGILHTPQLKSTASQDEAIHCDSIWSVEPTKKRPILDFKTQDHDLKTDWRDFKLALERYGIFALYHFTDRSNLKSIEKLEGLFSWYCLGQCGIPIVCPGGNALSRNLDIGKGIADCVHLSFRPNQPMLHTLKIEKRIRNPIVLRIDPSVVYWKDTKFSDRNATDTEATIGGSYGDFEKIHFDIIMNGRWDNEQEKAYYQAEVLVKSWVPASHLHGVLDG